MITTVSLNTGTDRNVPERTGTGRNVPERAEMYRNGPGWGSGGGQDKEEGGGRGGGSERTSLDSNIQCAQIISWILN